MKTVQFTNEILIRSPKSRVAAALANPDDTEKFWYGFRVKIDGSKITYSVADHVVIEGEITKFVPESLIEMTFKGSWDPEISKDKASVVSWVLEEQDSGKNTYLKMTHSEMEEGSYSATVLPRGWVNIISSLKSYLETGEPSAIEMKGM